MQFENQPTATAPAQSVTITDPLSRNLDWSTFQLKTIGFICTANYYLSRCSEYLFNRLAEQKGLPWRATSRSLRLR